MIDPLTRKQLESVLIYMERLDPNGDYITYIDDIEAGLIDFREAVVNLIQICQRWKKDIASRYDPKYKGISRQQTILAALI